MSKQQKPGQMEHEQHKADPPWRGHVIRPSPTMPGAWEHREVVIPGAAVEGVRNKDARLREPQRLAEHLGEIETWFAVASRWFRGVR